MIVATEALLFSPKAITFLRQLARNNDREWFTPRKDQYEELCRRPMLEMVARINEKLSKFAADYVAEPNKAVYRIYRDTRFSKDKTPYKTHVAATLPHRRMMKHDGASLSTMPLQIATSKTLVAEIIQRFRPAIAICDWINAAALSDREDGKGTRPTRPEPMF